MPADYASYVRIGEKGSGNSPETVGGENGSRRSTVSMNSILVVKATAFARLLTTKTSVAVCFPSTTTRGASGLPIRDMPCSAFPLFWY